jgi:hypothetical protein
MYKNSYFILTSYILKILIITIIKESYIIPVYQTYPYISSLLWKKKRGINICQAKAQGLIWQNVGLFGKTWTFSFTVWSLPFNRSEGRGEQHSQAASYIIWQTLGLFELNPCNRSALDFFFFLFIISPMLNNKRIIVGVVVEIIMSSLYDSCEIKIVE